MKKVLVLGATGAMGRYLVPELIDLGYTVTGVGLEEKAPWTLDASYVQGNAFDKEFLAGLLKESFDGIVNFMDYGKYAFSDYYKLFLENTEHYIFLSSCRVFANDPPITEKSARLLDVSKDEVFLATDDYALAKAKQENILRSSAYSNWTIVRPATTYSRGRFQLVTLEAQTVIYRMHAGKTIVLPEPAMPCQATLSWGGDVAKMLAKLLFNERAYREDYNVATAEHHSWREIAEIYNEICPFKYITVSVDDYLNIIAPGANYAKYQLIYARMFERITDNTKVLEHTGMKQSELMVLKDGLAYEYGRSKDYDWARFENEGRNARMDEYLKKNGLK